MRINKTNVEALSPPATGMTIGWDDEVKGFGIRVTANGVRSYIAQARVRGKTRRVTIGRHGVITAETARKKAKAELGRMTEGTDPTATRKRDQALSITLREVAEDYQRDRRNLKDSTRRDIRKHIAGAFDTWADLPVSSITRDKVSRKFRSLSDKGPAQANQAFRVLRALLNYARSQYRTPDDEPVLPDNPVNVISESRMWNTVKARNTYVPLDRMGEWWSSVQRRRMDPALTPLYRTAADTLAFIAVTGLRIGEASALRWDQVDIDDGSLTLTDTKNREDITLPLSDVAVGILSEREREGDYVFPGKGGGHIKEIRGALGKVAEETGIEVTAHDLRRTFRAVAGKVGVELWQVKALMNHRQRQDITLGSYTDLTDVRYLRDQANRIAEWMEEQRRIAEAGNVLPLSSASST